MSSGSRRPAARAAERSGRLAPEPQANVDRRAFLAAAARLGLAASTLGALDAMALTPDRAAARSRRGALPDIQFDVADHVEPARTIDGVVVRLPPVYTTHTTFRLARRPTPADQERLRAALATVERCHPFSPRGVLATVAYGVPYFERLPGGMRGRLVRAAIPRLRAHPQRLAFEEAQPGPTDVGRDRPDVVKSRFHVPVRIEANDMAIVLRSDSTRILREVIEYLTGERALLAGRAVRPAGLQRLLRVTSQRTMFQQAGLPRQVAERHRLPYAERINPRSPMWMGFSDQQVTGTGPAAIATFAGNASARLTTARRGDYFDHASVLHLSHVLEDLDQFYADPYGERVQLMFRSNPPPARGAADQFADGGGPAFLDNAFRDAGDAWRAAAGENTPGNEARIGHLSALQRSSRAPDSTPLHVRIDGAGFDAMDVPDGSLQPKLQFAMFVPTAELFATMRRHQGAQDLARRHGVKPAHQGIERFITTTRRQNFLVPPRRHRAFPLVERAG